MFPSLSNHSGKVLLFARVVLAAVFAVHAYQKWELWVEYPPLMPEWIGMMLQAVSVIEPFVALALLLGFFTRFAALVGGIIMVGAIPFKIFILVHSFSEGNATGWEFDLVILALCLCILAFGAGSLSLDERKRTV